MKLSLVGVVIALLLSSIATGQITVESGPCLMRLSVPSVPGADSYQFRTERYYCYSWYTIAEYPPVSGPVFEIPAMQGFSGRFAATARDANGTVLQTFLSEAASFGTVGPPALDSSTITLTGFRDAPIDVSTSPVPPGTIVRWYRDGFEIPDAVGSTITLTLDPSLNGASIVPIASNECGSSVGGARVLAIALDGGLLHWRSIKMSQSGFVATSYDCGWHCASVGRSRTLSYPTVASGCTPSTLSGGISGEQGYNVGELTFVFDTTAPLHAVFSGGNSPGIRCVPDLICGTAVTRLRGVVQQDGGAFEVDFPTAPGPWGPVHLDLSPGRYTVTTSIWGGCFSACSPCYSCGFDGGCGQSSAGVNATFVARCAGDFDNDGAVTSSDLARVFNAWGTSGVVDEDLDRDGFVGTSDLSLLLGNWGDCP